MELLDSPLNPGYPAEYLLSRIRGRRSRLITDWSALIFEADPAGYLASPRYRGFVRERTPEGMWENLVREYRWVYLQMNEELRELFGPFFLYSELRTLFICLRHLREKKLGTAGELLDQSLLSRPAKEILAKSADPGAAVERLQKLFFPLSPRFAGMARIFESEELRGVEQFITNTYLEVVPESISDVVMRAFFARLIDTRNILRLYKYFRYEHRGAVPVIPGGLISPERLRALIDKNDVSGLHSLAGKISGVRMETADPADAETALYRSVTLFLRREGREPLGTGLILDYLWKCSLEVMNLSLLFSAGDLERERLAAELIH
jgi:vacuolar-type H+-ATPase subunit C/Vma6